MRSGIAHAANSVDRGVALQGSAPPPASTAPNSPPFSDANWHARSSTDVLAALGASPEGLSSSGAARRLAQFGPNRLTPPPPRSALQILLAQFRGVVTLLLVSAAGVSLAMGERLDAIAIGAVIGINALLGFVLELRARRAMEALLQLGAAHATVVRDGRLSSIDADYLVPGDVVDLASGQTVPADGRVIRETDLRTNEAALTGESLPVGKDATVVLGDDTALADRTNMVYRGTTVIAGVAKAVLTSTGNDTEVGRIGTLTRSVAEENTPLERRLDALGRRLVGVALGVAVVVGLLGVLQGESWWLMLETAIALAVAAVPEGLPAVATIALAVGLRRMAHRHALVRKLSAVEALGSTTVVCTDKTRTLTSGDMSVARIWAQRAEYIVDADHQGKEATDAIRSALRVATLASRPIVRRRDRTASAPSDDPVDAAILTVAEWLGIDTARLLDMPVAGRIPFSSELKYSATFLENADDGFVAYTKGSPRTVIEMCGYVSTALGPAPLSSDVRAQLTETNDRLAASGLRVLALASGQSATADQSGLRNLVFAGFVGLIDPPAAGVKSTIATLRAAGLRIVMLTGDQRRTAQAIGRELGVLSVEDEACDSREWRSLSPDERHARVDTVGVFSRISAEDKLTIVSALQARGEIVAMLGDGVNDAPALRKADVGVAMGQRGTDVARQAASIVLQDDRFETIAAAVEEGRVIADNIRKFVFYLFSCNLAEILVLLGAGLLGLPLPLLPLQILWLNLVTDTFPALALALEPGDADVMKRPPRDPREAILSGSFFWSVVFYAALLVAGTFAVMWWAHRESAPVTTMVFMTLALGQIFHLGNARSERDVLHPAAALTNRYAIGAVVISCGLQALPLYVGSLGSLLQVTPLSLRDWLVVGTCASLTAVVGQAVRLFRRA
jgi:P-type Ca2+ transporter type 2C